MLQYLLDKVVHQTKQTSHNPTVVQIVLFNWLPHQRFSRLDAVHFSSVQFNFKLQLMTGGCAAGFCDFSVLGFAAVANNRAPISNGTNTVQEEARDTCGSNDQWSIHISFGFRLDPKTLCRDAYLSRFFHRKLFGSAGASTTEQSMPFSGNINLHVLIPIFRITY